MYPQTIDEENGGRSPPRLPGLLRLGLWAAALWLVYVSWDRLGGLVDERLRWLARFAVLTALGTGYSFGGIGRDLTGTSAGIRRPLLYPPLLAAAAALVLLDRIASADAANVVLLAILGYAAGVDAACRD